MKHKKALALLASAVMVLSSMSPAFVMTAAAEDAAKKYADGTYTAIATVESDDTDKFADYKISVSVTTSGGGNHRG